MKRVEGFIDSKGGKTWYEIAGKKKSVPLIILHGGPGYPHDSLRPLEALAKDRQVIFYDQLGCGNSEKTNNKSHWTVDYFVEELQGLVKELKLKEYHLLGHSWGAALGVAYADTKPSGLRSLVLSSPYLSTPHWEKDAIRLIQELPSDTRDVIGRGELKTKEYEEASREYYIRHVWGMRPEELPVEVIRSRHKMNTEIYNHMWGPSEFKPTGTLRDLDLSGRLPDLNTRVLYLCGRNDEATPETTREFQRLTPNSEMVIFEKSAHNPHHTQKEKYIKTVRGFLHTNK